MPYLNSLDRLKLDNFGIDKYTTPLGLTYLLTQEAIRSDPSLSGRSMLCVRLCNLAQRYFDLQGVNQLTINDVIGALTVANLEDVRRNCSKYDYAFDAAITTVYQSVGVPTLRRQMEIHGDVFPEGTPA